MSKRPKFSLADTLSSPGPETEPDPKPSRSPRPAHPRPEAMLNRVGLDISGFRQRMEANAGEVELDPEIVAPSPFPDRVTGDDHSAFKAYVRRIEEHGQQVPALVRPHPDRQGHYQLAYGHRRWRAARILNRKLRAIVKPLTDDELILAQGIENNDREDLTFIERARFAVRLEDSGRDRNLILAALRLGSKGDLSRMITIVREIGTDFLDAIGEAPAAGRPRWTLLMKALQDANGRAAAKETIDSPRFPMFESDSRFSRVLTAAQAAVITPSGQSATRIVEDGVTLGTVQHSLHRCTISLDSRTVPDFGTFVTSRISDLYREFVASRRGSDARPGGKND